MWQLIVSKQSSCYVRLDGYLCKNSTHCVIELLVTFHYCFNQS